MALPTIFEICEPRNDAVRGTIQELDFAADLKQVIPGEAPEETKNPALIFANTRSKMPPTPPGRNSPITPSGTSDSCPSFYV